MDFSEGCVCVQDRERQRDLVSIWYISIYGGEGERERWRKYMAAIEIVEHTIHSRVCVCVYMYLTC